MVLAETDPQVTANIVIRRTVANEAQRILRRRSSKSLILYDSDADDDEKDHDQHDDHDAISETEQSEGIPRRRRSSSGDLARISCDDLVEGQLIGSGAFNDVYSVRILNIRQNSDSGDATADADANTAEPRRKISNASTVSESVQSDGDSTHHGQCACRHIGSDEPGGYVIKHLRPSVMNMAPEIALADPYGLSADAYSFGIILHEICAMKKPFGNIKDVEIFKRKVICGGRRPIPKEWWPACVKELENDCWMTEPCLRPKMNEVVALISDFIEGGNDKWEEDLPKCNDGPSSSQSQSTPRRRGLFRRSGSMDLPLKNKSRRGRRGSEPSLSSSTIMGGRENSVS